MLATQVLLSTRGYPFPGVVEQPFFPLFFKLAEYTVALFCHYSQVPLRQNEVVYSLGITWLNRPQNYGVGLAAEGKGFIVQKEYFQLLSLGHPQTTGYTA